MGVGVEVGDEVGEVVVAGGKGEAEVGDGAEEEAEDEKEDFEERGE